MCDVAFGPWTCNSVFWGVLIDFSGSSISHVNILSARGINLIYSLCIARGTFAIGTTTKLAHVRIICFYFYSEEHLVWLQLCLYKTKSFLWANPACWKEPSCISPWWIGCCTAIAVWIALFCKQPLKGEVNSRSHTTLWWLCVVIGSQEINLSALEYGQFASDVQELSGTVRAIRSK